MDLIRNIIKSKKRLQKKYYMMTKKFLKSNPLLFNATNEPLLLVNNMFDLFDKF